MARGDITFDNYRGATVTVVVRPSATLHLRTWIGLRIIALGCRIATFGYRQEMGGGN